MTLISAILTVTDEEVVQLPRALSSLKGFANEIVIIHLGTSKKVRELASKHNAKVYKHERVPYVELIRNFGILKSAGDWVLIMDPDEELPDSLAKYLKKLLEKPNASFYAIPRKNIVFGKWLRYSRWWPDYNIRFFKKGAVSWNEVIHAVPMTTGTGRELPDKEAFALIHNHYQTVSQFLIRMDRYTTAQAKLKIHDGYDFSLQDLVKKPFGEFLSRFFAGEGYRDGLHGLALSLMQAFSELIVYLKVWEAGRFKEEDIDLIKLKTTAQELGKDTYYWFADAELKNGGGIKARIKRKLKLA